MMVANPGAAGARFMTSQHWRLHQEYPEALAEATKPFADLVQRELEEARAAGLLTPRDPERDAWLINRLVMSVFHHYAFAEDDAGAATVAEDVWEFCLAAVGGVEPARRLRSRPDLHQGGSLQLNRNLQQEVDASASRSTTDARRSYPAGLRCRRSAELYGGASTAGFAGSRTAASKSK